MVSWPSDSYILWWLKALNRCAKVFYCERPPILTHTHTHTQIFDWIPRVMVLLLHSVQTDRRTDGCYQTYYLPASWSIKMMWKWNMPELPHNDRFSLYHFICILYILTNNSVNDMNDMHFYLLKHTLYSTGRKLLIHTIQYPFILLLKPIDLSCSSFSKMQLLSHGMQVHVY